MNRNLLAFSLFLILIGAFSGYYFVSALGIFLLIPSLLPSPRRPPTTTRPTQSQYQSRRITPPIPPKQVAVAQPPQPSVQPSQQATMQQSTTQQSTGPVFSQALFPTAMFPAMSGPTSATAPAPAPQKPREGEQKDELLEMGALLALLRLALG